MNAHIGEGRGSRLIDEGVAEMDEDLIGGIEQNALDDEIAGEHQHRTSLQPPVQLFVPWRADPRCRACRQIDFHPHGRKIEHHIYLDLKISAARGCPLCQFLYAEISSQSKDQNMSQRLVVDPSSEKLSVVDFTSTVMNFEVFSTLLDNSRMPADAGHRSIAPHTDSEECWSLITSWLATCRSSHPFCIQHGREKIFPSQVLDVTTLRLVTKSQVAPGSGFVTLSHCWGSSQVSVTTESRLGSYRDGLDMNMLPKTFQDAITVTRKLGFQYLWIDALCIVQDNLDEWAKEATLMGQYYRDCAVNISALSAHDGRAGFLLPRPPISVVQLQSGLNLRRSQSSWSEVFQQSPLSQRAWVLQERLVSPRIIHFSERELFWECDTISARESNSQVYTQQGQGTQWEDENFKRSLQFPGKNTSQIMDSWYKVVSQYSCLQLTMKRDIFPAISGIAQIFSEATGFQYIAGMWLEDIHSALLWYRLYLGRRDFGQDRTTKDWRAPSWSWASLEGPVRNLYESTSVHMRKSQIPPAEIVDHKATPMSGNSFGAILNCHLQIYALCTTVWCKTAHGPRPFNDPYLALILDIYGSDGIMFAMGYRDFLKPNLGDNSNGDIIEESLAVVISQRFDRCLSPALVTYFLLLAPVAGSGDEVIPTYERIGVGHTADSHTGTIFERDGFANGSMREIKII
ncbi:hypothetical protein VTL71DRAFT_2701 [Oculimacula yallundae]|uniref:Heterokaryon incompatibility domain-containing protein n=1 Tax=Oculimacula yallundae TaxID=86028 RepID=A0ABR4C9L0_9HELO